MAPVEQKQTSESLVKAYENLQPASPSLFQKANSGNIGMAIRSLGEGIKTLGIASDIW